LLDISNNLFINAELDGNHKSVYIMPKRKKKNRSKRRDSTPKPPTTGASLAKERVKCIIEIVSCRDLLVGDENGYSDPYVKVLYDGNELHRTHVVYKTLNPIFNDSKESRFNFECDAQDLYGKGGLEVHVKDYNVGKKNDRLGTALLPFEDLYNADNKPREYQVTIAKKNMPKYASTDDSGNAGLVKICCRKLNNSDASALPVEKAGNVSNFKSKKVDIEKEEKQRKDEPEEAVASSPHLPLIVVKSAMDIPPPTVPDNKEKEQKKHEPEESAVDVNSTMDISPSTVSTDKEKEQKKHEPEEAVTSSPNLPLITVNSATDIPSLTVSTDKEREQKKCEPEKAVTSSPDLMFVDVKSAKDVSPPTLPIRKEQKQLGQEATISSPPLWVEIKESKPLIEKGEREGQQGEEVLTFSPDLALPNPEERVNRKIEIISCRNLFVEDQSGLTHPYYHISLGDRKLHSNIVHLLQTINRSFNMERTSRFTLDCNVQELFEEGGLKVQVKDWARRRIDGTDHVGVAFMPSQDVYDGDNAPREYLIVVEKDDVEKNSSTNADDNEGFVKIRCWPVGSTSTSLSNSLRSSLNFFSDGFVDTKDDFDDGVESENKGKRKHCNATEKWIAIGVFGIFMAVIFVFFLSCLKQNDDQKQPALSKSTTSEELLKTVYTTNNHDMLFLPLSPNINKVRYYELSLFLLLKNYTSVKDMKTLGTPQNFALRWLAEQDPAQLQLPLQLMTINDNDPSLSLHLSQRYALAVLYYSTCCGDAVVVKNRHLRSMQKQKESGDEQEQETTTSTANSLTDNVMANLWNYDRYWMTGRDVCSWYGVVCNNNGVISVLNITQNNLRGTIPSELSILGEKLHALDFRNNRLYGTIPSSISSMTKLRWLSLEHNELTGTLPTGLGALKKVRLLELGGNNFTGAIPSELDKLAELQLLQLNHNHIQLLGE